MPVVPTYDNLQTGIRPGRANISGPAPGAIGAQQLQEAGRALSDSAGVAGRMLLEAQQEANDLRVNDALSSAVQARTDAQLGVMKLRGRNALDRPDGKSLPDESAEALRQQFDAIRDGLGNDAQKQAFQARAQQFLQQHRASVGEHVLREYTAHRDQVDEAGIAAARRQSDAMPDDDKMRSESIGAIRAIVGSVAERKGWVPEQREAALIAALTPVHMGVIAHRMRVDVDKAAAYFEQVKDDLDPKARADVQEALTQRTAEVKATGAVRELTAGPDWSRSEVDRALVQRFANQPEQLKMARAELAYQDQLKRDAQAEQTREALAPMQQLLGDALGAGRMIGPADRERTIGGLRLSRPDLYAQGSKLIDQHNDEIRSERRAAESHARSMASSGPEKAINGLALRYDMLQNPDKYRHANLMEALTPKVRSGEISPQALEDAINIQQKLRSPKPPPEFATLMSGGQYLDNRLSGAVIGGKAWTSMTPKKQAVVKAQAMALAEPLLQDLQRATGQKADQQQIKAVIDSLFVEKRYRDKFLGFINVGDVYSEQQLDPDSAAPRLVERMQIDAVARIPAESRARIEQALRARGIPPTPEIVLQYWQAR